MQIPGFHVTRSLISGGIPTVHNYTALRLVFPRLDVFRLFQLILMRSKVLSENHIAKSNDQLSVLVLLMLSHCVLPEMFYSHDLCDSPESCFSSLPANTAQWHWVPFRTYEGNSHLRVLHFFPPLHGILFFHLWCPLLAILGLWSNGRSSELLPLQTYVKQPPSILYPLTLPPYFLPAFFTIWH